MRPIKPEVTLLSVDSPICWDASPLQGTPIISLPVPIYTPGLKEALRIEYLAQEHNMMSLVSGQTWTARSREECINHEGTMSSINVMHGQTTTTTTTTITSQLIYFLLQ